MDPRIMDAVGLIGRFVSDHWDSDIDQEDILDELTNLGFSNREISDAFRWIERNTLGADAKAKAKVSKREKEDPSQMIHPPMRVLSNAEQGKINSAAHGVMVKYYERGLIDAPTLEEIIDRAMRSDSEEVGEKEIRRIASLTLFNRVQSEWRDYLKVTNTSIH